MNEGPPLLVVVTGPPGAGKTTIAGAVAERLALPLVAKDAVKEVLGESLGVSGRTESYRLGVATFDVVFHVLEQLLRTRVSVVAEGNFSRAEPFARLPPARVLQVHVSAPPEMLRTRLGARTDRHAVHYDADAAEEIAVRAAAGEWKPLELEGALVRVDTSSFPDVAALAGRIAKMTGR